MSKVSNHTKHDFACAMLFFDLDSIEAIHNTIDTQDIFIGEDNTYGLEHSPHVSILMGLHGCVCGDNVIEKVKYFDYGELLVNNISIFPPRPECQFEILKFDVLCDALHEANKLLCDTYPHTTYFNYHPHCTIAYLKKGRASKYIDLFKDITYKAIPTKIVYSFHDELINYSLT